MMKSFLLMAICMLLAVVNSKACEICGCSNNNFQIGLLPTFKKGFAGLRYSTMRYSSHVRDEASEFSHDHYQTVEFWGGYNFKKFQVMAFMPYVFSRKESDDGTTISNGLGDLLLLVNYKVLSSPENTSVRHDLFIGGGIKLPTGNNHVDIANPDFNIGDFNSQAGTGSIDYMINVTHNMTINRGGLVTNVAYRINTSNADNYRFGNRMYLNTAYYYTFTKSEIKIRPSVGINYQSNAINSFDGSDVEDSNGYNLNSTVGVNLLHNKIGFNAMAYIPMVQNVFDGQTKLKSGLLLGATYSF